MYIQRNVLYYYIIYGHVNGNITCAVSSVDDDQPRYVGTTRVRVKYFERKPDTVSALWEIDSYYIYIYNEGKHT